MQLIIKNMSIFFDNDLAVNYDANEDCSLDFLFEFSTERSVGFLKLIFKILKLYLAVKWP